MLLAFRTIAAFNTATAVWLGVMFLILKHPAYGTNAALAFAIAAFCALAFFAAAQGAAAWLTAVSRLGSLALAGFGAWAIYRDIQPGASFEGFILIIGAAWIVQGVLSLPPAAYASAGAAPSAGPRA